MKFITSLFPIWHTSQEGYCELAEVVVLLSIVELCCVGIFLKINVGYYLISRLLCCCSFRVLN